MIAVATLLVAVVGATFAYFTATNKSSGTGDTASVKAAKTSSIDLKMAPKTVTNSQLYPGGYVVAGVQVTATKDVSDTKDYTVKYQIDYEVDASALDEGSSVKYSLYRATSAVDTPVTGCTLKSNEVAEAGKNKVYYDGCTPNTVALGTKVVTEATITGGAENSQLHYIDSVGVDTDDANGAFYYLLVEYVNDAEASQDADQGKSITAKITSASSAVVSEKVAG